jgi:hypothetical protein
MQAAETRYLATSRASGSHNRTFSIAAFYNDDVTRRPINCGGRDGRSARTAAGVRSFAYVLYVSESIRSHALVLLRPCIAASNFCVRVLPNPSVTPLTVIDEAP